MTKKQTEQSKNAQKALYDLLQRLNQENQPFVIKDFVIKDIIEKTGWTEATVKTYLSKKLKKFLKKNENGSYNVNDNIKKYDFVAFKNSMSQVQSKSQNPFKPNLKEKVAILVEKAKESAILAVDTYNRAQTSFRTQGFIVLMIICLDIGITCIF